MPCRHNTLKKTVVVAGRQATQNLQKTRGIKPLEKTGMTTQETTLNTEIDWQVDVSSSSVHGVQHVVYVPAPFVLR
ncbi:hypothetical protein D9M68_1001270 [compost metagenome]